MNLTLSLRELQILDNELYVCQKKFAQLNFLSVDCPLFTPEEENYKNTINTMRTKVGKLLEKNSVMKVADLNNE